MLPILLPALLCLMPQDPKPAAPETKPAPQVTTTLGPQPLGFLSFKLPFRWDTTIPINGAEVDGLKINSIFFNKRGTNVWPLKGADFGTRAQVEVTNNATKSRLPGFAVAVFDEEDRLLGVATEGAVLPLKPGATKAYDLGFHQVLERLSKGDHFYLSVELSD